MCRKPVESTRKVFAANNSAIKRRRQEELSKRIANLPCKHDNSNK